MEVWQDSGGRLTVAGIGPGAREYATGAALAAIEAAPVLAGARRALATFARPGQKLIFLDKNMADFLQEVATELKTRDVTVLVAGDPGFYSLLPRLRERFGAAGLTVIPGISSLQFAFSRLQRPWQGARFLSVHGRAWPETIELTEETLAFLTDEEHTPAFIAERLLAAGRSPRVKCCVLSALSYPEETIVHLSLGEMRDFTAEEMCVVIAG